MKKSLVYSALCVMLGFSQAAWSQAASDTLFQDDHQMMTSIARYPKDLQLAILSVSQYPQVLVKLERIQSRSSQSFQDLISRYPRNEQENFYEISRYPDRLDRLVGDGKKNALEIRPYLEDLPIDTRNHIMAVYDAHFDDLVRMNGMYQRSEAEMKLALTQFPEQVRSNFQKVVARPEAMSLLTENIDLTMNLGNEYQANPDQVIRQLDSLSGELASQDEKTLSAYRQEVENNPALQKEMINASDSFSATYSNGSSTPPQQVDPSGQVPVVNNYYYSNYNYNPYPYWFSYPYWYTTAIWYPRPYWYYTGFYYGAGGRVVVFGLPSPVYTSWFYRYGYRRYPYLYTYCHPYYRQVERRVVVENRNNYRSNYDRYSRNRTTVNSYRNPGNRNAGDNRNYSRSSNPAIYHTQIPANRSGWRSIPNNNSRSGQQLHLSTPTNRTWQHGGGNRQVFNGGNVGGGGRMSNRGSGSGHFSGAGHISGGGHSGGGRRGR